MLTPELNPDLQMKSNEDFRIQKKSHFFFLNTEFGVLEISHNQICQE